MSGSLYWEPATNASKPVPKADHLLRDILSTRYELPARLDQSDLDYLTGLRDAGMEGARELIKLISKHEAIIVSVIY